MAVLITAIHEYVYCQQGGPYDRPGYDGPSEAVIEAAAEPVARAWIAAGKPGWDPESPAGVENPDDVNDLLGSAYVAEWLVFASDSERDAVYQAAVRMNL